VSRARTSGVVAVLAAAAAAFALAGRTDGARGPSFNHPFPTARIDACVRPRQPRGIPAYTLDGARLPFTVATGHEPGTRPRCPPGELRILRLQALTVDGQPAYVRRGGCQQPCVVRQPTVHVLARDLAGPVELLGPDARGGDGAPAASCPRTVHTNPAAAGPELGRMFYKTPDEIRSTRRRIGVAGAGARWSNYGDPGRRYRPRADYGYLLWNLPRTRVGALLPGGGIVEAVIRQGQALDLCTVPALPLPAFDAGGRRNGEVVFGYARAGTIYGWALLGYRYRDRPFRPTTD
jgi:hypothetical protein